MRAALAMIAAATGCGFTGAKTASPDAPVQGNWLAVFAGNHSTCALGLDRSLWCWGDNAQGQIGVGSADGEVPEPTRVGSAQWTTIAVGGTHACGLQSDGSLWCWGRNLEGQLGIDETTGEVTGANEPTPVAGAISFTAIATGYDHTCAIAADHSLYCWGDNSWGAYGTGSTNSSRTPMQVSMTSYLAIASGAYFTCGVRADQTLWCAGYDYFGELGNGTSVATGVEYEAFPVEVPGTWSQIAAGLVHACGITSDGHLRCWGSNQYGQLGDGTTTDRWTPEAVGADHDDWTAVAAGDGHTCGARSDGALYCWGNDANGQLAVTEGDAPANSEPTAVAAVAGPTSIALGAAHSCAIDANHVLSCTGLAAYGQLGDGTTSRRAPVQIAGSWDRVSGGGASTCARSLDGSVSCWGDNTYGELADGRATPSQVPAASTAPPAQQLAVGAVDACDLDSTGAVWCWGDPSYGKTGDMDAARSAPGAVPGVNATALSSRDHTCAIAATKGLWCWGNNLYGQLGDGNTQTVYAPQSIYTGTTWIAVAAGGQFYRGGIGHTCAITASDYMYCWGDNQFGQIGNGQTSSNPVLGGYLVPGTWSSVALGAYHSCAITSAMALACWGSSSNGQLGDGTMTSQTSPEVIGSATWAQLALGTAHTCGIENDGSLWCWGANLRGEVGDGTSTDRAVPTRVGTDSTWTSVTAGDQHACAVKSDHTLWCWGSNGSGQIGDGTAWRAAWMAVAGG